MIELKRAEVRTEDDHQVIVLPADIHIDKAEVYVEFDPSKAKVSISTEEPKREKTWQDFFDYLDSLNIPQEDLDEWMVDRPLNVPLKPKDIFGDEE